MVLVMDTPCPDREAGQGGRCRVASGTVLIPFQGLASFILATSPEGGRTSSLVPWDVIPVEGTQAQRGHMSSQAVWDQAVSSEALYSVAFLAEYAGVPSVHILVPLLLLEMALSGLSEDP